MSINTQDIFAGLLHEGWNCYHAGNLARGRELCGRILAANPGQPQAITLQAFLAYRGGRLDLAIAQLRQAVQAYPSNPDFLNNLGIFYSYAGLPAAAVDCYQGALRLRPNCANTCNNLTGALLDLGRATEALASSEQALRQRPNFAEAHNNRGLVLLELCRPEEAAEHFRAALRSQPHLVEAKRNLGKALTDEGQLPEAAAAFQEALEMRPGFAEVHVDWAEVLKQLGQFEQGVAHLRQALRIKPNYAFAMWLLGQYGAQGLYLFGEEEFGHVSALLKSDRLSLMDKSLLHLTLADVLDRREAYDAAFEHYRQAGLLRQDYLRQTGRAFDATGHRNHIDQLTTTLNEAFFAQPRPAGSDSEVPIFVVGMPRSGTTLVEQILSSHSQVCGAGELPDLEQLVNDLSRQQKYNGGYPACLRNLEGAALRGFADQYLRRLAQIGGPATRVIDKLPGNFLYLGIIAMMFPRARIIHCRREPLDVCLSCYFQNFHRVAFSWSLEDVGQYHRDYERLMAHWKRVLPLPMLEVSYEDLVSRQEAVSRELVAFCGLDWEDRCLAFHKNPRPVRTASVIQVRRQIYTTSIGRWKNYAAHLEPLRRALGLVAAPAPLRRLPATSPSLPPTTPATKAGQEN